MGELGGNSRLEIMAASNKTVATENGEKCMDFRNGEDVRLARSMGYQD